MNRAALSGSLVAATALVAFVASPPAFQRSGPANRPGIQAEVSIAADQGSPGHVVVASGDFTAGLSVDESVDAGQTWTPGAEVPAPPGYRPAGDPALAIDDDGTQMLAFIAYDGDLRLVTVTRLREDHDWRPARFVRPGGRNEDKPALAVGAGRFHLAWTVKSGGASTLFIAHSDDDGATWSKPLALQRDFAESAIFAGIAVGPVGDVYVAWIAGRDRLVAARSTDRGESFGKPVTLEEQVAYPNGPCPPGFTSIPAQPVRCVGPGPQIAVDRSSRRYRGRVHVVVNVSRQDGTEDIHTFTLDRRLRVLHRSTGVRTGDQFYPALAVDSRTGRVWTCFYDTNGLPRTRTRFACSVSQSGGASWSRPAPASPLVSDLSGAAGDRFDYGEYAGLAIAGGVAHPAWTGRHGSFDSDRVTARLTRPPQS